jgi:hypothetical protein
MSGMIIKSSLLIVLGVVVHTGLESFTHRAGNFVLRRDVLGPGARGTRQSLATPATPSKRRRLVDILTSSDRPTASGRLQERVAN